MNCFGTYTIKIGNSEFEFDGPISDINDENFLQNFIQTLNDYKIKDPELFNQFNNKLNNLYNFSNEKENKIKKYQNPDLLYIIQNNLKSLGVEMIISTSEDFRKEGFDSKAKAAVKNGKIYVLKNSFEVSDVIHELSHLLFSVLKIKDFKSYESLIRTLYQHPIVKNLYKKSIDKSDSLYSENFELDKQEEAVVMFIEYISSGKEFQREINDIDVVNFLNEKLEPIIKEVLGVTKYPGLITFFNSLIEDIPNYGSELFKLPKMDSTGFVKYQDDAKKSAQISNYINSLIKNKIIKEGDCQ